MNYWERRAIANQAAYDRASAKTLRTISRAYNRAIIELCEDAEKIIGNFSFLSGLDRKAALELLKRPAPKSMVDEFMRKISTISDERIRQQLIAEINAPAYAARINQLNAIREAAKVAAMRAADVQNEVGQQHLREMVFEGFNRSMYDIQRHTGLAFDFVELSTKQVERILKYKWSGRHFSDSVWRNASVTADKLSSALVEIMMMGKVSRKTFEEMMLSSNEAQFGRYAANRLLRTETNYVTNMAQAEAYESAGIEKYRYMAVLDARTSKLCREKDGKEYYLKDKQVGVNYPPLHPFCRSTTEAVIDGLARDKMKRWARDPATGEQMKVPADISYREWDAGQKKGSQ